MAKRDRPFVITTLAVAFAILYSGNALQCYQCNSLENDTCAEGPLPDSMIIECGSSSAIVLPTICTSMTTLTPFSTSGTTLTTSISSSTTTTTSTGTSTAISTPTNSSTITPTSTSTLTTTSSSTSTSTTIPSFTTTSTASTSMASPSSTSTSTTTLSSNSTLITTPSSTSTSTTTPTSTTSSSISVSTTTSSSTSTSTTTQSSASTSTTAATSTSTTMTTPLTSVSTNTPVSNDEISQSSLPENQNAVVLHRSRQRRSIPPYTQQNTYAEEEWNCAIIKYQYNNDTVIERTCVPSNYTYTESSDNKCEIAICSTDECNNASAISINMVTLIWFMLPWTTVFILTGS